MSQNKNNPYAQAAGAYDSSAQAHTTNQRELEGRVLLKSNRMLQDIIDNWETRPNDILEETLAYNRQIWMLFYDTALENKEGDRPDDLRSNIVNLANFIFKRELEILANPKKEKLDILININREIAAGLMMNNDAKKEPSSTKAPIPGSPQESKPGSNTDISG